MLFKNLENENKSLLETLQKRENKSNSFKLEFELIKKVKKFNFY